MAKRNRKRGTNAGSPPPPPAEFRTPDSTRAWADRAALALFALFVVAVYVYAAQGSAWVDGLDETIGEVLAQRGDHMDELGRTEDAAELFRDALATKFDDPKQRLWTYHKLADAYIRLEQFGDAARTALEAIPVSGANGRAYSQFQRATWLAEDMPAALEAAIAMRDWAHEHHRNDDEARAEFMCATAQRRLGQTDDALASYVRSFELAPAPDSGWGAAVLLAELGRPTEALPYLETVIERADGSRQREAVELRETLQRKTGA